MSFESVTKWLASNAPDARLIEAHGSTATVRDAAETLGVDPGRIAKTLTIRVNDAPFLLVTRGDARLSNAKCKAALGGRPRLLDADETLKLTGHPVGGVCPFGLANPLPVLVDESIKPFSTVFPAAGSRTASVELTPTRLFELVGERWVNLCDLPDEASRA